MMGKDILVGIDLGTTTLKAVFINAASSEIVASHTEEVYPAKTENSDWLEYDPNDWMVGTIRLLRRGFEAGIKPERIAGLCFSGPAVMALFADDDGVPVTNSIHYNDMRHLPEIGELEALTGKECVFVNGNHIGVYSGLAKQYWWRKNRPDIFGRARSVHTEASWMVRQLTGIDAWNRCEAGFYGQYGVEARDWDNGIIKAIGFPRSMFPKIYDAWDIVGTVTREAAALTGLACGTPVVAGADDASPVALATGSIKAGQCFLSVGSAGNIAANTIGPVSHPTIITYPHCIPGLTTAITVMSSTGLSYKWARNALCHTETAVAGITGGDPYDYMNMAAANSSPGAYGVIFLPYLDGDYTPNNDPNARGCFIGMDSGTTKADMLRAVLEGVAFSILDNISLIREVGGNLDEIVLTGGIAKSDVWMQIVSDVTGCSISLPEESEGTAFGNALIAGLGTGLYISCADAVQKMVRINHCAFVPDKARNGLYRDLFEIYKDLYRANKGIYAQLDVFRRAYCH